MVDVYLQMVNKIIRQQQVIVGPLALEQAKKVSGLIIDKPHEIKLIKDGKTVVTDLIDEYANLFGKASVEVCRDAVREISPPVPADMLPSILK